MLLRTISALSAFLMILSLAPAHAQWQRISSIGEYSYALSSSGGSVYVGTETAVHRSDDGGVSWSPCAPLPDEAVPVLSVLAWNDDVFIAPHLRGVFHSRDKGATWLRVGNPALPFTVTDMVVVDDTLYAGTDGEGVYAIALGHPGPWRALNDGLYFGVSRVIHAIASTPTHLLAGAGQNGGVYRRAFGTSEWERIELEAGHPTLTAYDFHVTDAHVFAATNNGVYRAPLDASRWEYVGIRALPTLDAAAITEASGVLYAGIARGDYFIASSGDEGANWMVTDHEFALLYDLHAHAGRLFAAREDGLWWRAITTPTGGEHAMPAGNAAIRALYPQPAREEMHVLVATTAGATATLRLVDMLGRTVLERDIDGTGLPATVTLPVAALPRAVYRVLVQDGRRVEMRSVLLGAQ